MARHFRFSHLQEDAADGSDLVAGFYDDTPWYCEVCGEYTHNVGGHERCVFCSQPRNSWLCEDCGHRNPPNTTDCQECGNVRDAA